MGYQVGNFDGRVEVQSSMKYAFAALAGNAETLGLQEAAHQSGFMPKEDGSSYAAKDKNKF